MRCLSANFSERFTRDEWHGFRQRSRTENTFGCTKAEISTVNWNQKSAEGPRRTQAESSHLCAPQLEYLFRSSALDLQLVARTGLCRGEPRGQYTKW